MSNEKQTEEASFVKLPNSAEIVEKGIVSRVEEDMLFIQENPSLMGSLLFILNQNGNPITPTSLENPDHAQQLIDQKLIRESVCCPKLSDSDEIKALKGEKLLVVPPQVASVLRAGLHEEEGVWEWESVLGNPETRLFNRGDITLGSIQPMFRKAC